MVHLMVGRVKKRSFFLPLILVLFLFSVGAEGVAQPPQEEVDFGVHNHSTSITILNPLDGLGQGPSDDALIQAVALSDGSFGLVVNPTLSFGPFSTRLALTLKGQLTIDPFDLHIDFSDWIPPERSEEESSLEYGLHLLRHYSRFIQTFQFGNPYDPIYLRYGKLLGQTLGDGALINGYVDRSVGLLTSKPGLDVMIDASSLTGVQSGLHFLVDDLLEPTMKAWRIYSAPFFEDAYLSPMQLGFSYAMGKRVIDERAVGRHFFGLDIAYPLLDAKNIKSDLFIDILVQGFDNSAPQEGIGIRSGINGRLGRLFTYNFALTAPMYGTYYASFFSNEWAIENVQQLILPPGSSRFESLISLAWPKQEIFFGAKIASDLHAGVFENTRLFANLRFDRFLFNVLSLDLRYEKLYSNDRDVGFFDELMTLRMVDIRALAIIKVKPYVISLGVSLSYDENTHLTSTIDAVVRIVLL